MLSPRRTMRNSPYQQGEIKGATHTLIHASAKQALSAAFNVDVCLRAEADCRGAIELYPFFY